MRQAFTGNVKGGAVIGRRAHNRQAERQVDAFFKGNHLQGSKALVVVHGYDRAIPALQGLVENDIARYGSFKGQTLAAQGAQRRPDGRDFFPPEDAFVTRVRVERADADRFCFTPSQGNACAANCTAS